MWLAYVCRSVNRRLMTARIASAQGARALRCRIRFSPRELQCDIRKCFASIDHEILCAILVRHISCPRIMRTIRSVIDSFLPGGRARGIPLGNLTSQLFVNVYLHEFDMFVQRTLRCERYIRYADDMAIISHDRRWLISLVPRVRTFLGSALKLQLHSDKLTLRTAASGIDFLGWVHFPHHRVLRTSTKRRMFRALQRLVAPSVTASYLGLLGHGNAFHLEQSVRELAILDE